MTLRTCLSQVARLLLTKPHRRTGRRFGTVLESLECRLNLAAVLVIETTDAYWLYDDVDALVVAFSEGSPTPSSPIETGSEFTEQELQVIDALVAELMATEGYSDDEILAITYLEDTTSDELIASGFFEDAIFEEEFVSGFDEFLDFGDDFEPIDFVDATGDFVAAADDFVQLPGAAGNDVLSVGAEELAAKEQSQEAGDLLTASVSAASVEATADQSLVSRQLPRKRTEDAQDRIATQLAKAANSVANSLADAAARSAAVATVPAEIMTMVQPMANAAQFALPFAKFATTGLVATGIVMERGPMQAISMPSNSSTANDGSTTPADDTDGLSYSQITALFGAGGLAAGYWWNASRERESLPLTQCTRRRNLRERRSVT